MITTIERAAVPGRMDQKEMEGLLVELRAAINHVGHARRTTTTDGSTGTDVTIWSSPGMAKGSTTNLTFFVRASNLTSTGAYFHYNYMFTRPMTGSPLLVGLTVIDQFIGGSQTAAAVITADDGLAVTVNDGGTGAVYTWDAWIETRT